MGKIEFFFDISSPWTYLAFSQIDALAQRNSAELIYRPIIVGGVFNEVNQKLYEIRDTLDGPKLKYQLKDLQDWARAYGLKISMPEVFPLNAVKVMRGALVAQDAGCLREFCTLAFEHYWGAGKDLSQVEPLRTLAEAVGLEADSFETAITDDKIKARLRVNTDELIARGGFGSPSVFVNDVDMYFGNDRLVLVEKALQS